MCLARGDLMYYTRTPLLCQHLFSTFFIFFFSYCFHIKKRTYASKQRMSVHISKVFVREAYKPSSVIGGHLSRPAVTNRFKRNPESSTGRLKRSFVSCCERGLHRGQVARPRVSSYLTFPPLHDGTDSGMRYLSVALSLGSPPPGVTRHSALCSSDFPHTLRRAAARQPHKRTDYNTFLYACQRCDSAIRSISS